MNGWGLTYDFRRSTALPSRLNVVVLDIPREVAILPESQICEFRVWRNSATIGLYESGVCSSCSPHRPLYDEYSVDFQLPMYVEIWLCRNGQNCSDGLSQVDFFEISISP